MTLRERIAALFPCGSIVGAPKIRAAVIIRDLEPEARGFYTGALGAIAPNGDMAFNVAIRTAVLNADGTGRYGVGGGIVADSKPLAEYEEAHLKAQVLTDLTADYSLIETIRWSTGDGFVRLSLHLDRLCQSAAQLGFAVDEALAFQALEWLAADWGVREVDQRVRLQLARDGQMDISHAPVAASAAGPLRVELAAAQVDPGDPFLRHKTTRRELYDQAFAAADRAGLDEVLFLNRRGGVAEASRNSVFVEVGGYLVTPPLTDGVLPGVLRRELLEGGQALEGAVSLEAARNGPLWLGNSLHGLRPAILISP